ncbi:hypothetical protein [Allomuricauda sp. d1]|uniref:DinB family protein n=1 Tax=Allomuricauda sp. d1 TaxID=3136725 RepID=UPI0031E22D57
MELPFREIPEQPVEYSSGNIVSRMVDGLGFRYYWATEGLTQEDLEYRPTAEGRSVIETLQHIYGMSDMIQNAADAKPNVRPMDFSKFTFQELRKMTLENLENASARYAAMQAHDFEFSKVVFQRGDNQADFPFWNLLNGMLSDCIYHAGQITLMRRMNGNPINPNISVFTGKVRE